MSRTEFVLWLILALTAAIHVAGLLPTGHMRLHALWPLAFLPGLAAVMCFFQLGRLRSGVLRARLAASPRWVLLGACASFAYSAGICLIRVATYRGDARVTSTGFVLVRHGRAVRTLSESEYWQLARADVAFVFGLLVVFAYCAAALYAYALREPSIQGGRR